MSQITDPLPIAVKPAPPRISASDSRRTKRADPRYLSRDWRAFRLTILQRDGYRCVKCGVDVSGKGQARVDHIKRLSDGGAFLDPANCRSLCTACDAMSHREKGSGATRRDERIVIRGADASGMPLDPAHPWRLRL